MQLHTILVQFSVYWYKHKTAHKQAAYKYFEGVQSKVALLINLIYKYTMACNFKNLLQGSKARLRVH